MPILNVSNSRYFYAFTISPSSYVGIVPDTAYDLILTPYRG